MRGAIEEYIEGRSRRGAVESNVSSLAHVERPFCRGYDYLGVAAKAVGNWWPGDAPH
jgi:hypothetical protein